MGNTSEFSGTVGPPQTQAFSGKLMIGLNNAQYFSLQRSPNFPQFVDSGFDQSTVPNNPAAFALSKITAAAGNQIDVEYVPAGFGGDNIQIGGTTSYDQNLVALDALFAERTFADSWAPVTALPSIPF
jgi:hypothetical protein